MRAGAAVGIRLRWSAATGAVGRTGALIALAAVGLAAAACEGGEAAEAQQGAGGGPGGGTVAAVEVAPAELGSIARSVTVSGVIAPIRTVGVNSQLPGALLSIHAEEGDRVAAGEPLARLDDREIRAQLTAAEAAFEVADAAYQRAVQLRDQQVITLPEFERDRTARAAAKASWISCGRGLATRSWWRRSTGS